MENLEYVIMAKYGNQAAEEVDTAEDRITADYLVGEYRMAYGSGWRVWWKKAWK